MEERKGAAVDIMESFHAGQSYQSFFAAYPDVVTVEELGKMLNIGRDKAYQLVRTGQIKSVRIGHVYRIPKMAVFRYMEAA